LRKRGVHLFGRFIGRVRASTVSPMLVSTAAISASRFRALERQSRSYSAINSNDFVSGKFSLIAGND
jgi:hypothetical protein